MYDIINKFKIKSNISNNDIYYLYNGQKINMDLSFYNQANLFDKERNKINILVIDNKEKLIKEDSIKSNSIICPKCKQDCLIDIKNFKIKLYNCKNNHETKNILLKEFDNTQRINESLIVCKNCNKTNNLFYNRVFYLCIDCKINLCPLCKENHNKEHEIIDYNDIKYICLIHNDYCISYCQECKINLCMNCENKHDNKHNIINYKNILPEDNIKDELDIFRNNIYKLNDVIRDMKNMLDKISENMEIYFKIIYDIIHNFNKKKKNYEILKNMNIKDFINIPELDNILNNNYDYSKKFDILMNIYNKMNNIDLNSENEIKKNNIIDNTNQKEEKLGKGVEKNEKLENININNNSKLNFNEKEKIILCKTLKKTELNDKEIKIIIEQPKLVRSMLGSDYISYRVQTEPLGWSVTRKFDDFENLRKLISKFFPEFYVPFLKNKNVDKNIQKELENKKQQYYLNLFMNKLVQNESFKTSEILLAFLSYKGRINFEKIINEYSKKQQLNSKIEEHETINGKAIIVKIEDYSKYMINIEKYFIYQNQIFDRLNFSFKNYLINSSNIAHDLKDIKKNFEILHVLNVKVMMKKEITKTLEKLSKFFDKKEKIFSEKSEIIKYHFRDFFKIIDLEGQAFQELIDREKILNEKYKTELKKEKVNDNNLEIIYNQLGYFVKTLFRELKKITNEHRKRYVQNIKQFDEKYYPLINEELEALSSLKDYSEEK